MRAILAILAFGTILEIFLVMDGCIKHINISEGVTDAKLKELKEAVKDKHVNRIIVSISSPGGALNNKPNQR